MTEPRKPKTFDPKVQKAVDGLTYLGYLTDEFVFCGHKFSFRTLYGFEDLLVGLLTKEYVETLAQVKAWTIANVALSLTAVDGKTDFCPPASFDDLENARGRFMYVAKTWQYPTTEAIFARLAALQAEQAEAYEAMRDFSTRSLTPQPPSPDSLTAPGASSSGPPQGSPV